ncbi:MAG: RluA family pseudouridine synthase [Christensenellaceae bacterium]|nr:RluA family pseudouridine synthase [Christensenellaceae bacterium]
MQIRATAKAGRIDKFLSEAFPELTRSAVQRLIEQGQVTIDGKQITQPSIKPKEGALIELEIPEPEEIDLIPQDLPIDIVYEDSDIAVINKAQGMVVHPAAGNPDGTLVNAIMFHIKDLSGINGELRPGIVHRIDKDTSGLLVIAKNDMAHLSLADQIQKKEASRVYLALVHGNVKNDSGIVNKPIGRHKTDRKKMAVTPDGREAVSHYTVLKRYGQYTLVKVSLRTGRTHQIRVHMASLGHSIVGDKLYGRANEPFHLNGQLLHAFSLGLTHPRTGEKMRFYAKLPDYYREVIIKLNKLIKNED